MSDGTQGPRRPTSDGDGSSVLQNLPRTRPQRASPRRAAARRSSAATTGGKAGSAAPAETNGGAPRATPGGEAVGAEATAAAKSATPARKAPRRASGSQARRRPAGTAKRARRSPPRLDEVPPQGYESEEDAATGAVRPPGGAELVVSAAEIVGELARASLSRSERLVKDMLARLPLP